MVSVLIDDWLYLDRDGKASVYGRQEIKRSIDGHIKKLNAAFLDYQTKLISIVHKEPQYFEKILSESFDETYLIHQERLSPELIQVIAAKKDKVQSIYRDFEGIPIHSLVPYALAIRAVLKSRNLLDAYPYIIFLDDLGNQSVLTFFEGMHFSSPRRISMPDMNYFISEIKRTWQGFVSEQVIKTPHLESSFCVVSNNKQWLSDLVALNFVKTQQIVHLDNPYPVLQGLSQAKFSLNFVLADEIVKRRKKELFQNRFKIVVLSSIFVLAGLGLSALSYFNLQKEIQISQKLIREKEQQKNLLEEKYQNKFLSLMASQEVFEYKRMYFDFMKALPADYFVESFKLYETSQGLWSFKALISPENEQTVLAEFKKDLFYRNTKLVYVMTSKGLGQLITGQFNLKEE